LHVKLIFFCILPSAFSLLAVCKGSLDERLRFPHVFSGLVFAIEVGQEEAQEKSGRRREPRARNPSELDLDYVDRHSKECSHDARND
jgi:hypothetical protein